MKRTICAGAMITALAVGLTAWAGGKMTDDPLAMPYYTGNIYPTPQKVTYADKHVGLSDAGILAGKDVENSEPLANVLIERIVRYGGKATLEKSYSDKKHDVWISLGDTDLAGKVKNVPSVPDREQAYVMASGDVDGKPVTVLKGKDRLGLLWAIASFNQLVHKDGDRTLVRIATVEDYPYGIDRGYLHGNVKTFSPERVSAEMSMLYNVHFKFNKPVYKHISFGYNHLKHLFRSKKSKGLWRKLDDQTEEEREDIRKAGELLTPLGIEWYGGFHPVIGPVETKWHGSPEDIAAMLHYAKQIGAQGGNFFIQLDDFRFPLHPYDKEHFGTSSKADVHILNEMVKGLAGDYPDMRIMVCQPFYWGPTSPVPKWYGEPREENLALWGTLPDKIEMMWTGPKVQSTVITKPDVEWFTGLTRRKPVIWQNGWASSHPVFAHYLSDPVPCWKNWFYQGFLHDIDFYAYNSTFPGCFALVATIGDYAWNPDAYDGAASAEEAAKKLVGCECYETVVKLNETLSFFDVYGFSVTPAAAKDIDKLEKKAAEAERLWEKAKSQSKAVEKYSGLAVPVKNASRYVSNLRDNPKLQEYAKAADEIRQQAVNESGLNGDTDKLITAYDLLGALGPRPYANNCEKRSAMWIYGTNTSWSSCSTHVNISPYPPTADYELIACGLDDEKDAQCKIRITLNGKTVYEGESPFAKDKWTCHTWTIPAKMFDHDNRLTFENTEPGYQGGAPWFMINYAILRKTGEQ